MSATGDELFSKLTDMVRELKDAKDASDRRMDATEDTLKDVKDTLHESTRYDKATAESFKKLLEATKEHSKLLKDLKPTGLSGTDKEKGGLFGKNIITGGNVLKAGLAYEGFRTIQNRGVLQKYGPLAALMLGGGTYAAQGLGAAASQLAGYAGYGAAGAAGLYGLYRGARAYGPGILKGAVKGVASGIARTPGTVAAAGRAVAPAVKRFTGERTIGGTRYKFKKGSIEAIWGQDRDASGKLKKAAWIKKTNKKAFARASALAVSKGASGGMFLGAGATALGARAIPVIGLLVTAGFTLLEANELMSDPGIAMVFQEEFEAAGLLGKIGKTVLEPVKAVDYASKKIIESIFVGGGDYGGGLDKRLMKPMEAPQRGMGDPYSGPGEISRQAIAKWKEYKQYHQDRARIINDIVGANGPGTGLDDGYHYPWGMQGFATNPGDTNVLRYFTRVELQVLDRKQLNALKGTLAAVAIKKDERLVTGGLLGKQMQVRQREAESIAQRRAADISTYRYANKSGTTPFIPSTFRQRARYTDRGRAMYTDPDVYEAQKRRFAALVSAGKIHDNNFHMLTPFQQKFLTEEMGMAFDIKGSEKNPYSVQELRDMEANIGKYNQEQAQKQTALQKDISKSMTIAAEAFLLFIQEVKKNPTTFTGIFNAPGKGFNEQNNINNVYQTGGEEGNANEAYKNVGAKQ